jgi:hypothetical protein
MVPGALLILAPEEFTTEVDDVPMMFVAVIRTSTSVSKAKLKGLAVKVAIGMMQVRAVLTVELLPSQFMVSELQDEVEVLIYTVYAVIGDPLLAGAVQLIETPPVDESMAVVGVATVVGALAARIVVTEEKSPHPQRLLARILN